MKLVDRLRDALGYLDRDCPEIANDVRSSSARIEAADPWARFGEAVFERFWGDGDPGDLEGGDLQEIARECGLLGRTAEVDAGATHAEGCEWQPGMPADECDCWSPMRKSYRALVREQDGGEHE